ncbi:MAG TPA: hypothetical protein GX530_05615 [Corynebacteriales bacterium]|nr:hypothetical protein [Mycobacteriales bacterium]
MKFSSLIKAVAGVVTASLLMVTAQPVEANPVPTPLNEALAVVQEHTAEMFTDTEASAMSEEAVEARLAAADAYFSDLKDDGNTLVLGKGQFQKNGDKLAIVGESGTTLAELPLTAVFGDRMVDVTAVVKEGGKAVTFYALSDTERASTFDVQEVREGIMGKDTRLRAFYMDWGRYLNRMEIENFGLVFWGGLFGLYGGIGAGLALGVLTAGVLFLGLGLLNLIPFVPLIPIGVGVAVGLTAAAVLAGPGAVLGTIMVGFTSSDPKTRELAAKAVASFAAFLFLWWLPPSATPGLEAVAGSGVGSTGPTS